MGFTAIEIQRQTVKKLKRTISLTIRRVKWYKKGSHEDTTLRNNQKYNNITFELNVRSSTEAEIRENSEKWIRVERKYVYLTEFYSVTQPVHSTLHSKLNRLLFRFGVGKMNFPHDDHLRRCLALNLRLYLYIWGNMCR